MNKIPRNTADFEKYSDAGILLEFPKVKWLVKYRTRK